MANVTEKDIIDHLKEKIKFHQNEAKRIENLLTAFTGDSTTKKARKEKLEAVDEATEPLPAKKSRTSSKDHAAQAGETKSAKHLDVPPKYTDDLTINGKIAFALNEIGSGYNEDIANAMAQYEPKSDAKKIQKQISGILSNLKTKGLLHVVKEGRKDRFSLVQ